jgi:hypothetical protein
MVMAEQLLATAVLFRVTAAGAPRTCEGADPDRARYDSRGRSVPLQGSDEIRTRIPA